MKVSFFGKLSSGKFCRFQLDACLDRRYTFMRQFTDVFEIISLFSSKRWIFDPEVDSRLTLQSRVVTEKYLRKHLRMICLPEV